MATKTTKKKAAPKKKVPAKIVKKPTAKKKPVAKKTITKKVTAKKAAPKKTAAKKPAAKKKTTRRAPAKKQEVVVRLVQDTATPVAVPTTQELAQPIREGDGKALSIPKTWLNEKQIMRMVQQTPRNQVYQRKGRGGKTFDYVTGSYVEKVLNFVFGWNWDFEVVDHGVRGHFIWVQGKLTVRDSKSTQSIVKTQFGRAEIKYKRDVKKSDENMLDFGNDLKAATTDALKKCSSLIGIASDIYGKTEYTQETGVAPTPPPQEAPVQAEVVQQEQEAVIQTEPEVHEELICHGLGKTGCGNDITRQEKAYSSRMFGKPLCRACQNDAKPIKKK